MFVLNLLKVKKPDSYLFLSKSLVNFRLSKENKKYLPMLRVFFRLWSAFYCENKMNYILVFQ